MLFNAHLCNHIIILLQSGGGTWGTVLCTVRGVRGMGIRMLTFDTKTSLYTEDRGIQVPMTLENDKIVGTQVLWHTVPYLVRPDPRVKQRIYISLDTFRSRRMDHTLSQVVNKTNKTVYIREWGRGGGGEFGLRNDLLYTHFYTSVSRTWTDYVSLGW